jgi:hypothetical protein
MKRLFLTWLGGLMCLFCLTTCSKDEVEAAINQAIGEYSGTLEWSGGSTISTRPTSYTITKSSKGGNLLDVRVYINETQGAWEAWEIKSFAGGGMVMDRQAIEAYVPVLNQLVYQGEQEASGKIVGDSLILNGERFFSTSTPRTFCKYRARKKT